MFPPVVAAGRAAGAGQDNPGVGQHPPVHGVQLPGLLQDGGRQGAGHRAHRGRRPGAAFGRVPSVAVPSFALCGPCLNRTSTFLETLRRIPACGRCLRPLCNSGRCITLGPTKILLLWLAGAGVRCPLHHRRHDWQGVGGWAAVPLHRGRARCRARECPNSMLHLLSVLCMSVQLLYPLQYFNLRPPDVRALTQCMRYQSYCPCRATLIGCAASC